MKREILLLNSNDTCKEFSKKPTLAAVYARVSSDRQVNGYSLEEQIRLGKERCKIMGWRVRYIFCEDAKSASTIDRPKFQMMLHKAEERKFDVLVFWKLDRFCRSLLDVVNIEKALSEYGVFLHSITEQIDTTTSFGRFNFRNVASAAELERDIIRERSRLGMKALALQHKWPNKTPPLGYDRNQNQFLVINSKEAKLVKRVFLGYARLRSMPQLAFELNRLGLKTKCGKPWSAINVKNILDNELYIGRYHVSGVQSYIKEYRIISDCLFKKVQRRKRTVVKPIVYERKKAIVDKVCNDYFQILRESEKYEI